MNERLHDMSAKGTLLDISVLPKQKTKKYTTNI